MIIIHVSKTVELRIVTQLLLLEYLPKKITYIHTNTYMQRQIYVYIHLYMCILVHESYGLPFFVMSCQKKKK